MPGNPLPKIEINASRWPYDENGPANGKFGKVEVTAAPKAVFDAESNGFSGTNGFVKMDGEAYPIEEVPNSGGRQGLRVRFLARTMYENSDANEINYKILQPSPYVLERISLFQPANYEHPREMYFKVRDSSGTVAGWEIGDSLSTPEGHTAEIAAFYGDQVGLINFDGNPFVDWLDVVVTNETKDTSLTPKASGWKPGNSKFMQLWVSDSEAGRGYSNGMLGIGINPFFTTSDPDNSGNGYLKINSSTTDAGLPTKQLAYSTPDNEVSDMPNIPALFDTRDNGTEIHFFIERQRSSVDGAADGYVRIWKMTSRRGGDYPSWKLLYAATSLEMFSSYKNNCWTHGYIAGNKNGGYRVQTDFYYTRYEMWFQRPDFLPMETE